MAPTGSREGSRGCQSIPLFAVLRAYQLSKSGPSLGFNAKIGLLDGQDARQDAARRSSNASRASSETVLPSQAATSAA